MNGLLTQTRYALRHLARNPFSSMGLLFHDLAFGVRFRTLVFRERTESSAAARLWARIKLARDLRYRSVEG
jgi:hypothetical protein